MYKIFVNLFLFVLKLLRGNEILTSINGHKSVTILRKTTGNNSSLDLVIINKFSKFCEILSSCSQDIDRKRNSDVNQGTNSVTNLQKIMRNNPNLDLVDMNACI